MFQVILGTDMGVLDLYIMLFPGRKGEKRHCDNFDPLPLVTQVVVMMDSSDGIE